MDMGPDWIELFYCFTMNCLIFLPQQWTKPLAQKCAKANGFSEVHWRLFISKTLTKTFWKFAWSSSNYHLAGDLLRMYIMKSSPFGEAKLFAEFWIFTVVKAVLFCVVRARVHTHACVHQTKAHLQLLPILSSEFSLLGWRSPTLPYQLAGQQVPGICLSLPLWC